jgi:hypothetical protein
MSNPIAAASRILGPDFLGPKAYLATFGQLPVDAPTLHLTEKQLERIKDRGEQLVLMQSHFSGGIPLTMYNIYQKLGGKQKDGSPLLPQGFKDLYQMHPSEHFYITETPKSDWRIVAKTPIGLGYDYQGQTDELVAYIEEVYRKPNMLPACIEDAMAVYERKEDSIKQETDWRKRASSLASLGINQLLRGSAVETLLHLVLYNTGTTTAQENLLYQRWSWTNSRTSFGYLVSAGFFGFDGVNVARSSPYYSSWALGVLPSRSVDP